MPLMKICSRGHKNPPEAIMCEECQEDLSRLDAAEVSEEAPDGETLDLLDVDLACDGLDLDSFDEPPQSNPLHINEDSTLILFPVPVLTFQADSGQTFSAKAGDIIGRAETGADILQFYPTVSRLHFRLFQRELLWFMKNLSDNGTWLNGREMGISEELPLTPGDEIRLSTKCRLKVLP
jgi:hypothetical protein